MNIEDFEIKIKKYDREKNVVYINLLIYGIAEVRNFVIRYTETKHSPLHPVWVVNPPAVKGRGGKYFWIFKINDPALWELVQKKIIDEVKEYTDLL